RIWKHLYHKSFKTILLVNDDEHKEGVWRESFAYRGKIRQAWYKNKCTTSYMDVDQAEIERRSKKQTANRFAGQDPFYFEMSSDSKKVKITRQKAGITKMAMYADKLVAADQLG